MRYLIAMLVAFTTFAAEALTIERPRLPEIVTFRQNPFVKRVVHKVVAGGGSARDTIVGVVRSVARFVADLHRPFANSYGHLVLPDGVKKRYDSYVKLATEAHQLQEKYKGQPMPEDVGTDVEAKLKEAEAIWEGTDGADALGPIVEKAEADRERNDRTAKADERRRRLGVFQSVPNPTMPADEPDRKGVAGFVTLGDFVTAHQVFQKAADSGFRTQAAISQIRVAMLNPTHHGKGVRGRDGNPVPLIALNREERKAFEEVMEQKATPTIGSGVIEPERLDIIPQVTADDRLRLRDVIMTGQTTSNAVSYIREESFTRAAAPTAAGSAKPEAAAEWTEQTANVRTIPVWMPVTTEQLADWPQLRMLIDNRLLYDIRKKEEEQVMYGSGSGQNLEGLLVVSGTTDITASTKYDSGDDLLEKIRVGIVEVRVSGYEPNAVLIHPYDWHDVVTAKGTDDHYLGQVFLAQDRAPRIWSLDVVETIAAEENAGNSTEERNLVVGDFLRGCALMDRMDATVMVGLNSDDFTKNKRTILAEERVAFPIYAPKAFAYLQTQALST